MKYELGDVVHHKIFGVAMVIIGVNEDSSEYCVHIMDKLTGLLHDHWIHEREIL